MNEFEAAATRCVEEARKARQSGRQPVQLPLWDDDQRAAPSVIVRSALFGVVGRGKRKAVENQLLVSWTGNEIRYTGFRLDQSDLDCWLQVLHLSRQHPLGRDVRFTARSFLRGIGRRGGGKDLAWLDGALGRMQACGVRIKTAGGQTYQGPLIADYFQDEMSGRFVVRVNPLLADLFDESFVRLSLEKRLALPQGLPRYLHSYVQSHKATKAHPHRISLEQLRGLCGSELGRHRDFRAKVRSAMSELQEQRIVANWNITSGDALEFIRHE